VNHYQERIMAALSDSYWRDASTVRAMVRADRTVVNLALESLLALDLVEVDYYMAGPNNRGSARRIWRRKARK
jgi:hypothetical protein